MARKSRRQQNQTEQNADVQLVNTEKRERIPTAVYARLSVEKDDNESLDTQIMMIKNFIYESEDLQLVDVYADNGFSGTEFNRPEFIRLMEDVKRGVIRCIVIKDLSRFGRNYLETGQYIETLLPKLNTRLISINDHFDSDREEDRNNISIPLMNLVNEFYARDISKKVYSYHEMARKSGEARITKSTYGYSLDRKNNCLVVNPETAPVVRMIFRWYLNGLTPAVICKRLNHMQILTPKAYRIVREKGKELPENEQWTIARISDILHNQTYIGKKVWGKRQRAFYMQIPEHKVPKEDWIVYENQHEPLVTEETFYAVQEKIQSLSDIFRVKPELYGTTHDPLFGKVFCGKCGRKMIYEKYAYCSNRNSGHYYCPGSGQRSDCGNDIHADFLKMIIGTQMQPFIEVVVDTAAIITEMKSDRSRQTKVLVAENNYQKIRIRLNETIEKISLLYENYAEGIFEQSEYQDLKSHYQEERDTLEKMLSEAEIRRSKARQEQSCFLELSKKLESHMGEAAFSEELVELLIERVNVFPNKKIEIIYSCEDVFQTSADGGLT